MWWYPALIAVTVLPASGPAVFTATGVFESVVLLLPSCPLPLEPQQYALPSATAHEWYSPAVMAVTILLASGPDVFTATGTVESVVLLFPSCP